MWVMRGRTLPCKKSRAEKGATLSDKTARREFGLTQDELVAAIDAGQLQCRVGVSPAAPG